MITVVAVNFNSPEFAELLVESVERTASEPVNIILPDNSYREQPDLRLGRVMTLRPFKSREEPTHGSGLNLGLEWATTDEVLILDIDCHLLTRGWEEAFRGRLEGVHCVTVAGSPEKPIRPACCFMRTADAQRYDWRATGGYKGHRVTPDGFDVGILAYRKMIADHHEVAFMETTRANRYGTATGEEYGLGGAMYVYHHWHGTHLAERQEDYAIDLPGGKAKLFSSIPWRRKAKFL